MSDDKARLKTSVEAGCQNERTREFVLAFSPVLFAVTRNANNNAAEDEARGCDENPEGVQEREEEIEEEDEEAKGVGQAQVRACVRRPPFDESSF